MPQNTSTPPSHHQQPSQYTSRPPRQTSGHQALNRTIRSTPPHSHQQYCTEASPRPSGSTSPASTTSLATSTSKPRFKAPTRPIRPASHSTPQPSPCQHQIPQPAPN